MKIKDKLIKEGFSDYTIKYILNNGSYETFEKNYNAYVKYVNYCLRQAEKKMKNNWNIENSLVEPKEKNIKKLEEIEDLADIISEINDIIAYLEENDI